MDLVEMIRRKIEERKTILEAAGKILSKAHDEKRELTAEETQEFEKHHADGDKLKAEIDRLTKQLESERTVGDVPTDQRQAGREDRRAEGGDVETPEQRKELEEGAFRHWLRHGFDGMSPEHRAIAMGRFSSNLPQEARALTVTTTGGGYTVPQGFSNVLEEALLEYGGIMPLATILRTDTGAPLPFPTENDTGNTGAQVAINTAISTDTDPTFGVVTFGAYMFHSKWIKVPFQLMQDSAFDMDEYVPRKAGIRIGRQTNEQWVNGDGTTEPEGILTAAAFGVTFASATAVTYNELLDLQHSVDPSYRKVGSWAYSDGMFKLIRKMVDSDGRPIWTAGTGDQGISQGPADTLLGRPAAVVVEYATPASGAKSITFGDHKKFHIRIPRDVTLIRAVERFVEYLQIGFLAFMRTDSKLIDAGTHPVRYGTHVTS